ncbi:AAA family ATPase [Thioalkalivibrio sp. ALE11]|uniref:AAA family ATPase n=1 Tax=Thioalkalivibrio sp. ALE11 TaxID=1265494 RepID=UPI0003A23A73|nr:AAA family ATPase [Thioalkalivibrio sp. ALE11]
MPFINDRLADTERRRMETERRIDAGRDRSGASVATGEGGGIESRYRFDVDAIMSAIRREILGQDDAVAAVERMLRIVRADISDPHRPLHTALFLGPTGVGKTEIVRALARALHGDAEAFCRVDMNTLSQEHYAAALTGAPPGYVGSKEGTTLLDQERIEGSLRKPGIVLFDELEKASDEVVGALLNVFDNGLLTTASGERTYSFRNTLVFMTSNLGARRLQKDAERRQGWLGRWWSRGPLRERQYRLVERELLGRFAPEFVNRIDSISVFQWLDGDTLNELVDLELARLNRRLEKHRVELRLTESVHRQVREAGYDRKFGARAMRRAMRHVVEAPLAEYLLITPNPDSEPRVLEAMPGRDTVSFRRLGIAPANA